MGYNDTEMTKYLIIGLFALLLLLASFWFFSRDRQPETNVVPSASPSPSSTPAGPLTVSSTTPTNNIQNVGLLSEIIIVFSRNTTINEQENIIFSSIPPIDGYTRWSSDGTTMMISPEAPLQNNQSYTALVRWNNQQYEWTFKTEGSTQLSEAEQVAKQEEADRNFGQWSEQVNQNYPWLNKLPINTTNYFVYFDLAKNSFVGVLYPKSGQSASIDDQTSSFKQEVQTRLTQLEIPYQNFKFEWEVQVDK